MQCVSGRVIRWVGGCVRESESFINTIHLTSFIYFWLSCDMGNLSHSGEILRRCNQAKTVFDVTAQVYSCADFTLLGLSQQAHRMLIFHYQSKHMNYVCTLCLD